MSLKCSVFGHRFGEADVARERQEQGSEVVITITETETCERCGETRVLSQNKEVTTLETPSDIVGEDLGDGSASDAGSESTGDPGTGSAGSSDQSTPDTDPETPPDRGGDPSEDPDVETPGGPETAETPVDDAELVDEAESTAAGADGRTAGAGEDAADGAEQSAVASVQTDHTEDDGVILEDEESDGERAPGEWPQETDGTTDDDWKPVTDTGELRPVEEEQPDHTVTGGAVPIPEGEFRCPECGFSAPVESSSLREGDFCPECHRGSLERDAGE
jgi:ssDNA-binding Zn-finger/Zn-ribbon topoisomerase 1